MRSLVGVIKPNVMAQLKKYGPARAFDVDHAAIAREVAALPDQPDETLR